MWPNPQVTSSFFVQWLLLARMDSFFYMQSWTKTDKFQVFWKLYPSQRDANFHAKSMKYETSKLKITEKTVSSRMQYNVYSHQDPYFDDLALLESKAL